MSRRSRCDLFGEFFLDMPRNPDGSISPRHFKEFGRFEEDLKEFFSRNGFVVRHLKLDVKDGRFIPPISGGDHD